MNKNKFNQSLEILRSLHACGRYIHYNMEGASGRTRILRVLYCKDQYFQKDLQEYLGIKAGSMSELVSKMEQEGLLLRTKYKKDGRQIILSLTEKGKKEGKSLDHSFKKNLEESLSCLSEGEKEGLKNYLDKILNHWGKLE